MTNDKLEEENKISLEERKIRGGLKFPLDYEDVSVLKQSFIGAYSVILNNGFSRIYDNKISSSSVAVATHQTWSGTIGVLRAIPSNGYVDIESSSGTDNSSVNVLIIY